MSLYIGSSSATADFIAGNDQLKTLTTEIADRYLKPMIGEIKFVPKYNETIQGLVSSGIYRIPDDTFRGWVWADGGKFRSSDFPSAWQVYKQSSTSEFTIPKIADFIKGSSTGLFQQTNPHSECIKHNHSMTVTGSLGSGSTITINDGLAFASAKNADNGGLVEATIGSIKNVKIPRFHNGKVENPKTGAKLEYYPVPLDISLNLSDYKLFFGNPTTQSAGNDPALFSPASQRLAAMIYIGKKGE